MKKKRNMKKIFMVLVAGIVLLMLSGVFAVQSDLSGDVGDFVKKIAEKKGLAKEKIREVKKVDWGYLPTEVKIEDLVDDTNLALYEVDTGEDKPVYVITLSETAFERTLPPADYKRSYLHFGIGGEMGSSGFLRTATDVETSLEKGYVMTREGSITGISTNLEVIDAVQQGKIEIAIYKNGKQVGLRNTFDTASPGVKTDFDIISIDTVSFEPGDVVSVYIKAKGEILWRDIITMVEITTQ